MTHSPTPEQAAIGEAAAGPHSLMIVADAGTGKTTTLTQFVAPQLGKKPVLALAFNVKNKKDLEAAFPPHFTVKSLNGLGHAAWQSAIGKHLTVEERKLGALITSLSKEWGLALTPDEWLNVRQLVSHAMNSGLVPSDYPHKPLLADNWTNWTELALDLDITPAEQTLRLARTVLSESIKQSFQGIVSFDDQIYCSAILGGNFPRFGTVLVDEAQDLSPLNHLMVARSAAGRLIVVGDPKQAIYQFRGADSESMTKLRKLRPEWVDLRLSVTFRCPKVVVARQQAHAPGFTAWEHAPQGQVLVLTEGVKELEIPGWRWSDVPQSGPVAVLCRNNAPLLKLAFRLIRQWVPPMMLGRDIGKSLVTLSRSIIPKDGTPLADCMFAISEWKMNQEALARANGREDKIPAIEDKAESLMAVLESAQGVKDAGGLRRALGDLFERQGGKVTLASIHKAKGLEWHTVVHLDPWRIPSKWAKKANAAGDPTLLQQELNLRYVAETRTKHTLVLANLEDFS